MKIGKIVCMLLVLCALCSLLSTVRYIDHECTGEHCPVCAVFHLLVRTVKQLCAVCVHVLPFFIFCITGLLQSVCGASAAPFPTQITLKIRLNS
ncbi:hypothetical protein [Treponema brennaborense]|uniref:Uncharacterized protein n=1 Tax=Treponema brennaborense (strain DSM 12168 / CIP 105900 / DD5/3) TaxID=906968 RepID=F4LLL0_TREBD|nr:hypothetical protein [Treponema brennaborense]AEE16674.1 hypothetical protein Trebr_1246 [Treponema brennaborense DSM 12168]